MEDRLPAAFWLSDVLGQRGKGDDYEYDCACVWLSHQNLYILC